MMGLIIVYWVLLGPNAFTGSTYEVINILSVVPCEEVPIPPRRDHRSIFHFYFTNVDEPWFKFLEVKVNVNEILSVFPWFRNDELEVLFIPALADPTDVGELFRIHADGLSPKHYVIAVNVLMHKRMQRGDVLVLKF